MPKAESPDEKKTFEAELSDLPGLKSALRSALKGGRHWKANACFQFGKDASRRDDLLLKEFERDHCLEGYRR